MKLFHYQLQSVHGGIRFYLSLHSLIPPQHFWFIEYRLRNKRKKEKKKVNIFLEEKKSGGRLRVKKNKYSAFFQGFAKHFIWNHSV